MHTDVLALFRMDANTQFEHLSSEEFAQFSSVGMETKGWEAADVPSAPSADPHNAGIWKKNRVNEPDPPLCTDIKKLKRGESHNAEY